MADEPALFTTRNYDRRLGVGSHNAIFQAVRNRHTLLAARLISDQEVTREVTTARLQRHQGAVRFQCARGRVGEQETLPRVTRRVRIASSPNALFCDVLAAILNVP
jgi:hypothetical protein